MSLGFYAAQAGHLVPLIAPVDVTGGKTSPYFNLGKWAHASIVLQQGVAAAAVTGVTLLAAQDSTGTGATAIPFNVYKCETTTLDTLGAKTVCTAAGFVPAATAKIFYVIEIDAQALPQGYNWLALAIANGANSVIASAVAVLSGGRQMSDQSATVLS